MSSSQLPVLPVVGTVGSSSQYHSARRGEGRSLGQQQLRSLFVIANIVISEEESRNVKSATTTAVRTPPQSHHNRKYFLCTEYNTVPKLGQLRERHKVSRM